MGETMTRYIQLVVCVIATLCTEVAVAQVTSTSSLPVAYVYVSSSPSSNNYEINAFAAASNGKLTAVSGSPFSAKVRSMAVNKKYLFGTDGVYIYSFSIASDGALKNVGSINAQKYNGNNCGGPYALFLDRTGKTLYDEDYYGDSCANNTYQSFSIDGSTGKLQYLSASSSSVEFQVPLSFIGNNVYAYGSDCYHFFPTIFGFQRNGDGSLTQLNINPAMPAAQSGDGYCPNLATADPTNHVAFAVQEINWNSWQPVGPPQLATYTANGSGDLTTKSTYWNMPATAVKYTSDIQMSPSGKLLADAGAAGLQVFHFNGANPIKHYTGLLTQDPVDQMFWDNANHLYAISRSAGKLYVFTVTPTSVSQAPGSPYAITNPQNIIVLPKT
jgi:hypothetical protein